jgi:Flp pilus assembly protein TadG
MPEGVSDQRGQTLAEFALVIPVFMLFLIGLFEFAFAFNAQLTTNYATRAGGLAAAEAGNQGAADCLILNAVENAFSAPADAQSISRVDIQRTNPSGSSVYATSSYRRSGSTTCTRADGSTLRVPYRATSSGYPASQRCNVLGPTGCPTLSRTTVDTIAVQITYTYAWKTPLSSVMGVLGGSMSGAGWTFTERNVFRMEPVL